MYLVWEFGIWNGVCLFDEVCSFGLFVGQGYVVQVFVGQNEMKFGIGIGID